MTEGAGPEKLKVLGQKTKLFLGRKVRGKTLNQSPDGLNIQLEMVNRIPRVMVNRNPIRMVNRIPISRELLYSFGKTLQERK